MIHMKDLNSCCMQNARNEKKGNISAFLLKTPVLSSVQLQLEARATGWLMRKA